jgi:hypothetical protein
MEDFELRRSGDQAQSWSALGGTFRQLQGERNRSVGFSGVSIGSESSGRSGPGVSIGSVTGQTQGPLVQDDERA